MTDLKALRELCDAATCGDWRDLHVSKSDSLFIAATDPQTVRALIDEIERMRGALKVINAHAQNQREGQSRTMHMVAIDRISKYALKGTDDDNL